MLNPVSSADPRSAGAAPDSSAGGYSVQHGDTLWDIAQRHGVALSQLIAVNPQIANPDLIYPGDNIQLPAGASVPDGSGGGDTGGGNAGGGAGPVQQPRTADVGPLTPGSGSGDEIAALAERFLGRNASELRGSSDLPMDPGCPSDVCCANFVSAVLQQAGVLGPGEHSNLVSGVVRMLQDRGWKIVDASQAKPGDVCVLNHDQHIELVHSNNGGDVTLIGSNNINPDGSQQVSFGSPYGGAWYLSPP